MVSFCRAFSTDRRDRLQVGSMNRACGFVLQGIISRRIFPWKIDFELSFSRVGGGRDGSLCARTRRQTEGWKPATLRENQCECRAHDLPLSYQCTELRVGFRFQRLV